jgi:hypothetical protein
VLVPGSLVASVAVTVVLVVVDVEASVVVFVDGPEVVTEPVVTSVSAVVLPALVLPSSPQPKTRFTVAANARVLTSRLSIGS